MFPIFFSSCLYLLRLSNGHEHYSSPQTKMSEENEEYYQVVCIKEEVIEDDWSENDTTNKQLTESGNVSSNQGIETGICPLKSPKIQY